MNKVKVHVQASIPKCNRVGGKDIIYKPVSFSSFSAPVVSLLQTTHRSSV